jgi:hypothetical protein
MISEGSNTDAITVVYPALSNPLNVFISTGIAISGATPKLEFVLRDQDQTAAVSTVSFKTANVAKVKVTLLDKAPAEVKIIEVI